MTDAELLAKVVGVLRVIDRCSNDSGSKKSLAALAAATRECLTTAGAPTNDHALQLQEKLNASCEALWQWAEQKKPELSHLQEQHRLLEHAVIRFWKRQSGDL